MTSAIWRAQRWPPRGKRRCPDVAWFLFRMEPELRRISESLADGSWAPTGFELLLIHDPKRRARLAGVSLEWPPVGHGLPIGAHTSQFLATHVVLQALDHYIKRDLKMPGYVRFVDDLLLFGASRAELRRAREAIGDWLWSERRLLLKHPDAPVLSCAGHLDALGYRLRRDHAEPLPRAARRFRARIWRASRVKTLDRGRLQSAVASSVSHLLG